MAAKYQIGVIAKGDADSAIRALNKLEKRAGKFSGAIRGHLGKGMAVAGAAIGTGMAIAAKTGYSELLEYRKVSAQTSAVLASTGNAAGISKKGVEALANELQAMSGVEDDVIQASENMLLRFDKVGKKGGVFDRATRAALDYTAATGKDMVGASKALGMALTNPSKAAGRLAKLNVVLTAGQKKQIAAFEASGQTLKAQEVILGAVEKRYKGTAKAVGEDTPGQVERAKRAFETMSQTLVERFAPSAARMAEKATELAGRIEKWSRTKEAERIFDQITKTLRQLGDAAKKVGHFMLDHNRAVVAAVAVMASLDLMLKAVKAGMIAYNVAVNIVKGVTMAWRFAQWQLNAALIGNPIGIVVMAIAALVVGLVVAYKKSETFRNVVQKVWSWTKRLSAAVWEHKKYLLLLMGPVGVAILGFTKLIRKLGGVKNIVDTVKTAFVNMKDTAVKKAEAMVDWFTSLPGAMATATAGVWDSLKNGFRSALNYIVQKWNALELKLTLPKKLGGGSIGIGTPNMPMFAHGGVVTRPTLGVFGEAGDEALVPLGSSPTQRRDRARVMRAAGLAGHGGDIHIHINASQAVIDDPHALAARMQFALRTRRLAGRTT